jgi:Tol biopolymer transport system component
MIGQNAGHYRVTAKIGAGGMGEVYRATDTKLGREVALKVLPAAVSKDAERMARFEREAQVLASLNHPNIATIHGLEESGSVRALVMELVEGPTLAERIAQGPLPLEEALPIAKQIAEALEYAHERGIVHRDLKPANVKITPDGKVKVLDFGLAKALQDDSIAQDSTNSPTLSMAATKAGIILGTAAYMSPEQARGKAVDRRADIWAFGVVLYEMLTGRQVFGGETASDSMAAVIEREPDWKSLPPGVPPRIRGLLRRCLTKDPKQRLRDIGEARIAIEEALAGGAGIAEAESGRTGSQASALPAWRRALPWALSGILAIVAVAALWRASRPVPVMVERFEVTLPIGAQFDPGPAPALAISPDGKLLVFKASMGAGWRLYMRSLSDLEPVLIAGTDVGGNPFFSPDGKWLAFLGGGGSIRKMPVTGGAPQTVCSNVVLTDGRGATWGPNDQIIFSGASGGLQQVSAQGGKPQELTRPEPKNGEVSHRFPEFLPDGQNVLFTIETSAGNFNSARIAVLSLKTGQWRTLIEGGANPRYSPTGHIIFGRNYQLLAAPFNLSKLEVTGPAVPVADRVMVNPSSGAAMYGVSGNGTLTYLPFGSFIPKRTLVWVDRKGVEANIAVPPNEFDGPSLSPDGKRIAVHLPGGNDDVWTFDLLRGTLTRLTFQSGEDESPLWTPDGRRVLYASSTVNEPRAIYWKNGDGSGAEEKLVAFGNHTHLSSFSPDGKTLVLTNYETESRGDIWFVSMEGTHEAKPFLKTPFNEREGKISPDGRWIAYASDESGRDEVYVQALGGAGGKWQISAEGGFAPLWARSGSELFYRNGDKVLGVSYVGKPEFSPSPPRMLFEGRFDIHPRHEGIYDVSPDGKRFLMVKSAGAESGLSKLNVVVNWFEELKAHVSAGKN